MAHGHSLRATSEDNPWPADSRDAQQKSDAGKKASRHSHGGFQPRPRPRLSESRRLALPVSVAWSGQFSCKPSHHELSQADLRKARHGTAVKRGLIHSRISLRSMRATSSVRGSAKLCCWECRVDLPAAHEIKRRVKRLVVTGIQRDVRLRAGFFLAISFEVAKQRRFAAQVGTA